MVRKLILLFLFAPLSAEIIVDGKPLVWVLTRKNNKWTIRELKDTWVVKAKGNKWYKNN